MDTGTPASHCLVHNPKGFNYKHGHWEAINLGGVVNYRSRGWNSSLKVVRGGRGVVHHRGEPMLKWELLSLSCVEKASCAKHLPPKSWSALVSHLFGLVLSSLSRNYIMFLSPLVFSDSQYQAHWLHNASSLPMLNEKIYKYFVDCKIIY